MLLVITGGTKGIGKAIVEKFAHLKFDFAIAARNIEDLESTKQLIHSINKDSTVLVVSTDISKKEAVDNFVQRIKNQWSRVEVLVNNAGVYIPGHIIDEPDGNLENMLSINLMGAYHLTRGLVPLLINNQKGHIFNICSVASKQAIPNMGSYVITKHALYGFSKAIGQELSDKNIKVTSIFPGSTISASWEGMNINAQAMVQPSDVANAVKVAYESSEAALFEEIEIKPLNPSKIFE